MCQKGVEYDARRKIIILEDGREIHRSQLKDKFLAKHPDDLGLLRMALVRLNYLDHSAIMGVYLVGV